MFTEDEDRFHTNNVDEDEDGEGEQEHGNDATHGRDGGDGGEEHPLESGNNVTIHLVLGIFNLTIYDT